MVWKKVVKDIKNNGSGKISQGEKCEVVEVWLNNIMNDIYVKLKCKDGDLIITSIKSIDINS